ncbi:DNA translocase FtsK [Ancylobacter mangrovi]|uniref:DNA translocase FtsK n=1 Tax=Ancylobacter mangrovi TaxID=2972472 RepID=UPI00216335AE|nr:DNA translocase FtsK [Ancylobacter mangrovi]MCS0501165.1 FtsK/SpoIIIE domain-containing protein [Ancylobacter mangrovi]
MRNSARPSDPHEISSTDDEKPRQNAGGPGVSGHRFTRANPQTVHLPPPPKTPKPAKAALPREPAPTRESFAAREPAPAREKPVPSIPASRTIEPPGAPVPSWLQPFTLPSNTRFTRTPDYLLRPQLPEIAPEPEVPESEAPPVVAPRVSQTPVLRVPPRLPPAGVGAQPLIAALARQARAAQIVGGDGATPVPSLPPVMPDTDALPAVPPVEEAQETVAQEVAQEAVAPEAAPAPAAPPEAVLPQTAVPQAALPESALPETFPHDEAAGDPPRSIQLIAEMIRLGWDVPPMPPSHQDPLPEVPAATAPVPPSSAPAATDAAPAGAGPDVPAWIAVPMARPAGYDAPSVTVSFSWPAFTVTAEPAAPAPAAAPVAREPEPAPVEAAPVVATVAAAPVAAEPAAVIPAPAPRPGARPAASDVYELPPLELLTEPPASEPDYELSEEFLDRNSVKLQQVLHDFGVRGEIIDANPGPVVTLYELEPAPGIKSSRVIGLSADIARSMSAISARVAVVEGRNVIGIELPNQRRDTVWLREMLSRHEFEAAKAKLGIALGKTIGGEPVIVDLARMPHLLVAGTTGSGKSVAINTMILSLLYRHRPEQCRLIMIDPKMLELSVYEGIPHLLTPVVTDPKKAIVALKWAVREMEERYRKMSRLGVRNIDGFNSRVAEAAARGEIITRTVQKGFDKETGEVIEEEEIMDLSPLPYIVIVVDEMADLMMVAGKEIEGAIQRLAQMARAAGIHLIMATQRPSVDVITGTIKANFPTRISFQVTSKIDSRTILGEMGAEQLLGQGDMLYMAGGGRISRVHGPFVSDQEVERVVEHLKCQARPEYLDEVTAEEEDEPIPDDAAVFDKTSMGEDTGDLYDQAVTLVMRDKKASTSYIQRRLQIGYNRAASLMERMENEGIVGPANHAGKREILRELR